MTFSLWDSFDAVRASRARTTRSRVFYPEDDRYLVERDLSCHHWDVVRSTLAASMARHA